ncbi:diguanylate cyclase domain-containing protein [Deinococcus cellulosilyticus]|nr:diguanylate cyclase [Deinococcus cellulosilyticus]
MNLRLRSLLVLGVSSALVALVLFFLVEALLQYTFSNTERIMERTRLERVVEDLHHEAQTLDDINRADWALWDDSYDFIEKPTQDFIGSNLTLEALHGLRINVMSYHDLTLRRVYDVWMDWDSKKYLKRPSWMTPGLLQTLQKAERGLIQTPSGLMTFSVAPVRDSLSLKKPNGYLLMGRLIDARALNVIGERSHVKLELLPLQKEPDLFERLQTEEVLVFARGNTFTSYLLLKDSLQHPIYLLKSTGGRLLSPVLDHTRQYLLLTIVVMVLFTTMVPLILLNRTVLSRMAGLSEAVRQIRLTRDPRARLREEGRDELGMLSQDINHMLSSLEESRQQLELREQYFRILSETSSDALMLMDQHARIRYIGGSLHHLFPELEVRLGEGIPMQVVAEDRRKVRAFWEEVRQAPGEEKQLEVRHVTSTGHVWLEIFARNLLDDPVVQGVVVNLRDISDRKTAELEIQASHERFSKIFHSNPLPSALLSLDQHRFLDINTAFATLYGHPASTLLGMRDIDIDLWAFPEERRKWLDALKSEHEVKMEVHHLLKNGEQRVFLLSGQMLDIQHQPCVMLVALDITERKAHEARVQHMAYHDALTGLYNRHYLWAYGQNLLDGQEQAAFFFMDLDRFKQVNDTYGHESGDELLNIIVERLQGVAPETGIWFRLSGDEFGLLLPGAQEAQAHILAEKMLQAVDEPVHLSAGTARVGISIGIALVPEHGRDLQQIVRMADAAMYQAKTVRNTFVFKQ